MENKLNLPCASMTNRPIIFVLLVMLPRLEGVPDPDTPIAVLSRILVVCCRSSTVIVSVSSAARASGQMKL